MTRDTTIRPRRTLRCALLSFALLLAATASAASEPSAATLMIEGVPGVSVFIDDAPRGELPLSGPLTLEPGLHLVRAEQRGMMTLDREILLSAGDLVRLQLRLTPLSRKDAVLYSALLAGTGQRYLGREKLGWALTAAEVGGALTALVAEMNYRNHRDDYLLAADNYDSAVGSDDIEFWRNKTDETWDDMESAESLRNAALAVAAGAVVLGVLDAWLRFPGIEAGPGPALPPSAIAGCGSRGPGEPGARLAWRFSF